MFLKKDFQNAIFYGIIQVEGVNVMKYYELAVELWRQRNIQNDAELAEALNGHSIAFAYHSGKSKMKKSLITILARFLSTTA